MIWYDIIIKNGTIIDGSGAPSFKGDVGIYDGKISFIGDPSSLSTKSSKTINAKGLIIAPGFIDAHTHSDRALLITPEAPNRIYEGITTDTGGHCGGSSAPLTEKYRESARFKRQVDEFTKSGVDLDWSTMSEYLEKLEREGISINFLTLVGFRNIRAGIIGYEDRAATSAELEQMKSLTTQAMEDGAFGLSTGLTYLPGYYAHTDEIVECAKIAAKYGGIYASHIREWGSKVLGWSADEGSVVEAVEEAVEIGERSGVRAVQIGHMGTKWPMWGKEGMMFHVMEEARKMGVNVTADVFPHELASIKKLSALLPLWASEGGSESLLKRLKDPETQGIIRNGRKDPEMWSAMGRQVPFHALRDLWDEIVIYSPYNGHLKNMDLEGKTIGKAASEQGKDPVDFLIDTIISENDEVYQTHKSQNEDLRKEQMKHPLMMAGSDGSALSVEQIKGYVNPRVMGCYARMLGRWVREQNVLSWEEMIHKMTCMPTRTYGLFDRGLIRPNMYADIVVFNPNTIIDKATYSEPHHYSEGMKYVLVNGKLVLDKGKLTGVRPGKVLRNNWIKL
jgi:N-acyl-D-aspartate/D-glutamate deacylase